jgi:putative transposase
MLAPPQRGQVVEYLHDSYRVSERRACRVARMNRATFRYRRHRDPRTGLRMRIREIAQARVRYECRKIRVLLNREGGKVGKYLVERLYREDGLTLHQRRKRRRRVPLQCVMGKVQSAQNHSQNPLYSDTLRIYTHAIPQ